MANWFSLHLLLVVAPTIASPAPSQPQSPLNQSLHTPSHHHHPSSSKHHPPPNPPPPHPDQPSLHYDPPLHQSPPPQGWAEVQEEQQLRNIIEALLGAGGFNGWAGLLSAADPSTLPFTATLFIPDDDALSNLFTASAPTTTIFMMMMMNFDPFVVPYHIIPQRLRFSDLQLFHTHTRLPTLLPSNSILITNSSPSNFTTNDSPISHPDLYINSAVCVHGIKTILDYTLYGTGSFFPPPSPIPRPRNPETVAPPFIGSWKSDAAANLCTEFPLIFLGACAAFSFKIHGNRLTR